MHFIVHARDKPDGFDRRMEALAAHRSYMEAAPAGHGVRVLISGPMTDDAGDRLIGSFFLLDAPDRAAVDALLAEDPMALADVWADRQVTAFFMRINTLGQVGQ
ncbi:MAG: YciI family protein [Pseudomonadota bacterium]